MRGYSPGSRSCSRLSAETPARQVWCREELSAGWTSCGAASSLTGRPDGEAGPSGASKVRAICCRRYHQHLRGEVAILGVRPDDDAPHGLASSRSNLGPPIERLEHRYQDLWVTADNRRVCGGTTPCFNNRLGQLTSVSTIQLGLPGGTLSGRGIVLRPGDRASGAKSQWVRGSLNPLRGFTGRTTGTR